MYVDNNRPFSHFLIHCTVNASMTTIDVNVFLFFNGQKMKQILIRTAVHFFCNFVIITKQKDLLLYIKKDTPPLLETPLFYVYLIYIVL